MRYLSPVMICVTALLSACLPVGPGGPVPAADPALGQGEFVAAPPPPGRTPEERAARKDYYRGPRAQEF